VSITEADHLKEWFLSAATRGERVISLAAYGSLLSYNSTVWHPLKMSNVKSGVPIKPFSVSYELYSD